VCRFGAPPTAAPAADSGWFAHIRTQCHRSGRLQGAERHRQRGTVPFVAEIGIEMYISHA
jgi:hypothetical protein